jgi:hypothetical protein
MTPYVLWEGQRGPYRLRTFENPLSTKFREFAFHALG